MFNNEKVHEHLLDPSQAIHAKNELLEIIANVVLRQYPIKHFEDTDLICKKLIVFSQ